MGFWRRAGPLISNACSRLRAAFFGGKTSLCGRARAEGARLPNGGVLHCTSMRLPLSAEVSRSAALASQKSKDFGESRALSRSQNAYTHCCKLYNRSNTFMYLRYIFQNIFCVPLSHVFFHLP